MVKKRNGHKIKQQKNIFKHTNTNFGLILKMSVFPF